MQNNIESMHDDMYNNAKHKRNTFFYCKTNVKEGLPFVRFLLNEGIYFE